MKCILARQRRTTQTSTSQSFTLQSLEIVSPPTKVEYLSGETFDRSGLKIEGTYGVDGVAINVADVTQSVTITPEILIDGVTRVKFSMLAVDGTEIAVYWPVTVNPKPISMGDGALEISYTTTPSDYTVALPVTYSDGSTKNVIVRPTNQEMLSIGTHNITVSYTESGITVESTVVVTVVPIQVARPVWIGNLSYTGSQQNVNSAIYWENYDTTFFDISGYSGINAGDYIATFSLRPGYAWVGGSTASAKIVWDIRRAAIAAVPSQAGTLTYTGSSQTPVWAGYDENKMTISGDTTGVNAGTYTVVFTPTDNYQWLDGTFEEESVNWVIGKAQNTLIISGSGKITITSSSGDYKAGLSYTTLSNGAITLEPSSVTGFVSISAGSGSITAKSDGSTNVEETTITMTIAETQNYTSASATFTVAANFFFDWWGDEKAIGDASWWAQLKTKVLSFTSENELAKCIGHKKKVSLSQPILGANAASMLCVGYFGYPTYPVLVFQTEGVLPESATFGGTSTTTAIPQWSKSDAKTICDNFGNYCSASNSLTTCYITTYEGTPDDQRTHDWSVQSYTKCWLPSEQEVGLDKNSCSRTELTYIQFSTQTNYTACPVSGYQYYSSDERRTKKIMNASGNINYYGSYNGYFLRSQRYVLYQTHISTVCGVYGIYDVAGSAVGLHAYSEAYFAPMFMVGSNYYGTLPLLPGSGGAIT